MPAAISTVMMTTTTITDQRPLLRLLAWMSPAFPTGGYAYSHGLEWPVDRGEITNGATMQSWLEDILCHGAGRNDAILLRLAHRAANDLDALADLTELALAICGSAERRGETVGQGNAFLAAAGAWHPTTLRALAERVGDIPYPIATGALAGANNIAEDDACSALLQAFAANLISACVRLVPLGQSAGLAVLAALETTIIAVSNETRTLGAEDLGSFSFRADLAAMHHETQYTRLFRS